MSSRHVYSQAVLAVAVLSLSLWGIPSHAATQINPDLQSALAKANAAGKVLLVDFYGTWCPWCVKMDTTLADPGVAALVKAHYYYLKVNVGNFDQHTGCLKQYNIQGIPYLIVFNPDGSVRATCDGYEPPETFKTFLTKNASGAANINPDLKQALAAANKAGKLLLVDFAASWCPWCVKLDQSFADPQVKALIGKHFSYVKLDVGRFNKHTGCLQQYHINGIPHLIVFNADGSVRGTVDGYEKASDLLAFLQHQLTNQTAEADGFVLYQPSDFPHAKDAVQGALQAAGQAGNGLLVYFRDPNTDADNTIIDTLVAADASQPAAHFALLALPFKGNETLAKYYGCHSVPFLVVFKPSGDVLTFYEKPMSADELVGAMNKALGGGHPNCK